MATGISFTSTSNMSTGQKIMVKAAMFAFEPSAPNPDLIDSDTLPQGHKQRDILTYARFGDATALTEANDLSQVEQLVTASLSITPTEHGIIVTLSRLLILRQGDVNSLSATVGVMIANSLRRRQDKDVIALYDGFSRSVVGASTPLDVTHFRGSIAYLRTDNEAAFGPAPMPIRGALHPEQISDLILDLTDISGTSVGTGPVTDGLSQDLIQRWWRGTDRVYGVQVFEAGNIARDSLDDAKGGLFAKAALVIVMQDAWDATEEKDPSARLTEFGIFGVWGEGERADPHGVEVFSDAAATI